jgi:uncharacterized repeat protein (TIGR01451 family)
LIALAASLEARAEVTVFDAPNLQIVQAGRVETVAFRPDGSLIVSGAFSSINGNARNVSAKIGADGTLDPAWKPPLSGQAYASVVDSAGNVYVGGGMPFILKIDGNTGALDPMFRPILTGTVYALTIGPDGSLFVGGSLASVPGPPNLHLAKLDPSTGARDTGWTVDANGTVYALAATAAGSLYVGGDFTTVGGLARKNLARVGTTAGAVTDPVWNPQARSVVRALAPAASQIYVGGEQIIGGLTQYLVRYSTSGAGAIDVAWSPAADRAVRSLALAGAAIYAGGDFTILRGETHHRLARIPTAGDGHADAAWNPDINDSVHTLALSGDLARIEIGGVFSRVGTVPYLAAATLSTADAGVVAPAHDAETPGWVTRMAVQPDGGLVAGGIFNKVDQLRRDNLFRLKPDRTLDTEWEADVRSSDMYAVLSGPDNAIYAAGPFSEVNGTTRVGIVKLDGHTGAVDPAWDAASNSTATSLAWAGDGDLVVGGLFTAIGGESRRYLAKLRSDGTADPDWDPSPDNWVRTVASGTAGAVYVGGDFLHVGATERHYIVKIDAAGEPDPAWNSAADRLVSYIAAGPDGALYVNGDFDGTGHWRVLKLDAATGAVDTAWNLAPAANGVMDGIAFDDAGRAYVAASFNAFDGGSQGTHLARVSAATGEVDTTWNPHADFANVVAVGIDDAIFVGGNLRTIGGLSRIEIAALSPDDIQNTTLTFTSIDPELSHAGEPYTVSFRVDAPEGTPTGSVTIGDDAGAGCGPVELVDGQGSCEMASTQMGGLTLTALYSSDSVLFDDTTAQTFHFVDPALTTVTITADAPDPSELMGFFELDAHVDAAYPGSGPAPTGTVTFRDADNNDGCDAAVDSAGNASCSMEGFAIGTGTWIATYSGDALYGSSESVPETHTVTRASVVLTVIDGFGAPVTTAPGTFTVEIDGSIGLPTGDITIGDGTTSCTVEITSWFVSCDLAFAHAGEREVVATYDGDDTFAPAVSEPITHFVAPAQTAVSIRSHLPEPSLPGLPVTVTVDATVLPPGVGVPAGPILVSGGFGQSECTIDASGGSCDIFFSARGPQPIEAEYLPNDDFDLSVVDGTHRVNEPPLAFGDDYASLEDQTLAVNAAQGVLANDQDPDGDPLTVVDPGVQTASGIGGTVTLAADGSFTYTPPPNANGTAIFGYTISDGLETAFCEAVITVAAVNDPPTFALAPSPSFAPGTSGVQTTPAFAAMTGSGPPDEDDLPLAWQVRVVSDPSGVLSAPATIALDGTLSTPLSGQGGTATLAVALQDDGGTENGGDDTSPEQTFTVTVGDGTDLSVSIEDDATFIAGGDAIAYGITVRNAGPENTSGARVRAMLSANLVDAAWTCEADAGASCAGGGSGEIDDLANIPAGAAVVYTLTATTLAMPEFAAEIDATVTAPSGLTDFNPGNDSASDIDAVGIFADGFDTAAVEHDASASRASSTPPRAR